MAPHTARYAAEHQALVAEQKALPSAAFRIIPTTKTIRVGKQVCICDI